MGGGRATCTLIPREWTDDGKFPCPAGAQGLRWDTEAARLGAKTPVCGSARIFEHKAWVFFCFFFPPRLSTTKPPLKERSDAGLPLRACSLHSWEFQPSSPAPAHKTKAFQIRRNVGAARFASSIDHRSPQKTLGTPHTQLWIRLFGPQPLANIIFLLPYLG